MFTFLRRILRRAIAPKPVELEIADTPLNQQSAFWREARLRGDRVQRIQAAPDGLWDIALTRIYKPGDYVVDDLGRITSFPEGAQQIEIVQGVAPSRFTKKGKA